MKYISGADERRVLTAHLHISFCVLDVVGQLVVPDGLDDPGRYAYRHRVVGDDHSFSTSAPAPMMQFLPTTAWLRMVACIPMRLLSPTVQPWTRALWPTVTFLPRTTCRRGRSGAQRCPARCCSRPGSVRPRRPAVQPRTRCSRPCPASRRPVPSHSPPQRQRPHPGALFHQRRASLLKNHLSLLLHLWYSLL